MVGRVSVREVRRVSGVFLGRFVVNGEWRQIWEGGRRLLAWIS